MLEEMWVLLHDVAKAAIAILLTPSVTWQPVTMLLHQFLGDGDPFLRCVSLLVLLLNVFEEMWALSHGTVEPGVTVLLKPRDVRQPATMLLC